MSFVRNFCVESNEFPVSISAKGVIKLSEWSVKSMSAILMGRFGAIWMVNMSGKLMENVVGVDFTSKFNESRRGFLAQRCSNKGSRYVVVVEYGGRRSGS